jgi:hypothetical protein
MPGEYLRRHTRIWHLQYPRRHGSWLPNSIDPHQEAGEEVGASSSRKAKHATCGEAPVFMTTKSALQIQNQRHIGMASLHLDLQITIQGP